MALKPKRESPRKKRGVPAREEIDQLQVGPNLRDLAKKQQISKSYVDSAVIEKRLAAKNNSWRTMPMRYKQEMVMQWHLDGGVFRGKRYFKFDFAKEIGLTVEEIEKFIEKIKSEFRKQYESKPAIQKTVAEIVHNVGCYLQSDRSRVVMHADLFDRQIDYLEEVRNEIDKWPIDTEEQIAHKMEAMKAWKSDFSWATHQRVEAIKLLFESTTAFNRYLEHFSGVRSAPPGTKTQGGLIDPAPGEDEESAPGDKYVTIESAIELLDGKGSVLPTQSIEDVPDGPRSPDDGFEEFSEPDE